MGHQSFENKATVLTPWPRPLLDFLLVSLTPANFYAESFHSVAVRFHVSTIWQIYFVLICLFNCVFINSMSAIKNKTQKYRQNHFIRVLY